jgi:hypothetical protein
MNKTCLITVVAASLLLSGCELDTVVTGPMKDETIALDLNNAQRADVELDMGAGELNVRGGTAKLLQGHVQYNIPNGRPEVVDNNNGQTATVSIKQPQHARLGGKMRYRWDFELNDGIPLDVRVNCGAGDARLELRDLNLNNVTVHMGAGRVNLDLDGHPNNSYSVSVQGGVGEAIIRLPRNVGIRAQAHGGLGSIEVHGLTKHDDYYSNDLYGNAKVNVLLQVEGGIGDVRIIA